MAFDDVRVADVSELQTRAVSAVVLAIVALLAVAAGGFVFAMLVALIAAIALWEWTKIVGATAFTPRFVAIAFLAAGILAFPVAGIVWGCALLFVPTLLALLVGVRDRMFLLVGLGMLYVAVPCAGFVLLRDSAFGWAVILVILVIVWATDIAAYFCGRALGGPKLWPRVSPKKTWSGAIGGLLAALLGGGVAAAATGVGGFWAGFLLAAPLSIAAQAGDLFESALKRKYGVKDSGTIIPGHGGVLDRVDGLFGAAAMTWIIAVVAVGSGLLEFSPGQTLSLVGAGN